MQGPRRAILFLSLLCAASLGYASSVTFTPRELFRVPFGKSRDALGARIDGGNVLIPRDFTLDETGHVYIYDSNNHRIARFSRDGKYEIGFTYPATAQQIFAHADSHENLWLLISDPERGTYYGVYDPRGQLLKSGTFLRFTHFRLHPDDDFTLHIILSSEKDRTAMQTYILDEEKLLMRRENTAPPPENHHQIRSGEHVYFIDQVPDASKEDAHHVNRVTDEAHRGIANIRGTVIYMTPEGNVYTREGDREIDVYDVDGSLKGKVILQGLPAACAAIRFDAAGNIYELDGIPDAAGQYTAQMPGMRVLQYERH